MLRGNTNSGSQNMVGGIRFIVVPIDRSIVHFLVTMLTNAQQGAWKKYDSKASYDDVLGKIM